MQSDDQRGHTLDDLARLQAEGILEVHQPGTPGWHEHARKMAEELEVADAEAIAIHGPDALTSARLLRQTALACELDPECVGHAFGAWCRRNGWERSDLASWLGVTVDQLAAMAIERRADPGYPLDAGVPQHDLAER